MCRDLSVYPRKSTQECNSMAGSYAACSNQSFQSDTTRIRFTRHTVAFHPQRLDAARIRYVGCTHFVADAEIC